VSSRTRIKVLLFLITTFSAIRSWFKLKKGCILHTLKKNKEAIELDKAADANPNDVSTGKIKSVYLSKYLRRYIEYVEVLDRSRLDMNIWDTKDLIFFNVF